MADGPSDIVVVEDSPSQARLLEAYLRDPDYRIHRVETGQGALEQAQAHPSAVMLLDLGLPDLDGMDVLQRLQNEGSTVTVIVVTGEQGSVNTAVAAMRAGAQDFVVKPVDKRRLQVSVKNAVERQQLRRIVETFQDDLARERYHGFIGRSLAMQRVYRIVDSAAPSKATVFITGESGTGKEIGAEAIHRQSGRSEGPFVPINCAAIPGELMESELFGHVKGAFTGAVAERDGAALRAHGGTLFLDEICELELNLQTKLLRFLQSGKVQKVGGSHLHSVDCRIICATNRDPMTEVREGRFREDLYYRLHVIPLHLPPLREREDDVCLIADELLRRYAHEEGKRFQGFDEAAKQVLRRYGWPGNVRELQNVVRNLVVLFDSDWASPDMLPPPLDAEAQRLARGEPAPAPAASGAVGAPPLAHDEAAPPPKTAEGGGAPAQAAAGPPAPEQIKPLWQVEREAIEGAIAACDGNIPKAAALLEVSPSTLYRKRNAWKREQAGN